LNFGVQDFAPGIGSKEWLITQGWITDEDAGPNGDFLDEALRSIGSITELAAKIPILAVFRLLCYARDFESAHSVPKRLLITAELSIPTVILRDDAAANKTLA
jgi:hypothetical protein